MSRSAIELGVARDVLPLNTVLLGDCLERLKELPDESVDALITDPPYGLGTKEPTGDEIIAYLQGATLDTGGDFMNRRWSIPSVAVWSEVFRVLKPGAHALVFGGTRTYDLISIGLRAAAFECRDTIASMFETQVFAWVTGSGFPKGQDVHAAMLKAGIAPAEVAEWRGWNCQLKPSFEPISIFRKPLRESAIARQVLATGTGAMNIDACRVGTTKNVPASPSRATGISLSGSLDGSLRRETGDEGGHNPNIGRWPANVLFSHGASCKIIGTKIVRAPVINRFVDGMKPFGDGAGHAYESEQTGDADGNETIPVYECEPGCPVEVLDEQSGSRHSSGGGLQDGSRGGRGIGFSGVLNVGYRAAQYEDHGGASRFFNQFQAEPDAPFLYCPKVSKAERDRGLPKGFNRHPTAKPLKLMQHLVRLVTRKGGTVLDPFAGSGSTCIAALSEGCNFIGIERDPEFHELAVKRIAAAAGSIAPDVMEDLATLEGDR